LKKDHYKKYKNTTLPNKIDRNKEALKQALDIRKFEIDLYWKRATYFWAFVASIFAGYALLKAENKNPDTTLIIAISMLGIIVSFGWILVNKGSKFWHNNWEKHVNRLEKPFTGDLYSNVLEKKLTRFSVSNINLFISYIIFIFWIFIFLYELDIFNQGFFKSLYNFFIYPSLLPIIILCTTIAYMFLVFSKSKSK